MTVLNWNVETKRKYHRENGITSGMETGTIDVIVGSENQRLVAGSSIEGKDATFLVGEVIEIRPAKGNYATNRPTWQRVRVAVKSS